MNRTFVPSLSASVVMALASLCSSADAQFVNREAARWYGGAAMLGAGLDYGWGYGATTAAESHYRGMADVIRAQGQAAEAAARAASERELARSRYIENQSLWLEEYNRRKRIGMAEREAEYARRREKVDRYRSARESRKPDMPVPTQLDPDTGEIVWPDALRQEQYKVGRERIDKLFQARKETGISPAETDEIRDIVSRMRRTLQAHIRDYPANDFIAADKFLNSLAEAGSTSG